MDALALLCNLHADGPLTLQRLRRLGCDSIEALLDLQDASLASALGAPGDGLDARSAEQATARSVDRFRREATLLVMRLEERDDERELTVEPREERRERASAKASAPSRTIVSGGAWPADVLASAGDEDEVSIAELLGEALSARTLDASIDDDEDTDEDEDEADGATREEHRTGDARVDEVLAAWRSLDDATPPDSPMRYEIPRPVADPLENRALEETGLDGLTPDLAQRLAQVGVLSLRGLIDASPVELARRLPLAFTRVKRLQLVARRALAELPRATAHDETGIPAEHAAEPRREGAFDSSGPFA